jgi:aryl-alcohol dehydrogenase-like predicted oxidoreductase
MPTSLSDYAFAPLGSRRVMRVGYGAMQLEHAEPDAATRVLRRAVELGVDHIDTAEFYGDGVVNRAIRTALYPYPEELQLVSKIGAEHTGAGLVPAQRPEQLRAAIEANLASLGVDRLPVVNLRRVDTKPGIVATGDQLVDLDSQLAELTTLRDKGKIGGIGLSNVSLAQLRQAAPAGIACVQNLYNLLERDAEPTLRECERLGIAWVPFCPLGSAFANWANVADSPVVIEHAARLGITPAQAGLAWLLGHSSRTLLIPGTRSVEHLAENLDTARIELDDAAVSAFDRLVR